MSMRTSVVCLLGLLSSACVEPVADDAPVDTDGDTSALPDWCPPPAPFGRQDIDGTPASPYWVSHPDDEIANPPTLIFLPGGSGTMAPAGGTWMSFFDGVEAMDRFRVVMPYATTESNPPEYTSRVALIVEEIFTCFGGDPGAVHLAGHSNGGMQTFAIGMANPGLFTTLAGLPGILQPFDENQVIANLSGTAILLGVGEGDASQWRDGVQATAEAFEDAGFEVEHQVWRGVDHTPGPSWTGRDALFDWWEAH